MSSLTFTFGPIAILFIALAVVLDVACVVLASRRAQQIEKMSVPSLRDLVRELRKLAVEERPAELLRRAAEGTWEHRLAQEISDAPAGPARIAAANDLLSDVEHEIDVGKTWATAATRIALAGTCLLGVGAYLLGGGAIGLAGSLLVGFGGAGFCFFSGERGREHAAGRREAFDALVSALLPEEAAASRAARFRRRDRA